MPEELRELIRRMARENVLWGEERIANELLLKLGVRISPRTVRKYMPKRPPGRPRGDLRWSTFLRNQATAILYWRPVKAQITNTDFLVVSGASQTRLVLLCHKLISLLATAARARSHSSDEPEGDAMAQRGYRVRDVALRAPGSRGECNSREGQALRVR